MHTEVLQLHVHFVSFVEDGDHGVELSLVETKLLQHLFNIDPLSVELWMTEVSDIHKDILMK